MRRMLLGFLVLGVVALPVVAGPTVTISRTAGTYPGTPSNSGEWTVTPNAELEDILGQSGPFQSFCLETSETIAAGATYDTSVSTEAVAGNGRWDGEPAGPLGYDQISPETAFLYTQFRQGTLAGYDYTPGPGRQTSAGRLQAAIWYLEYETGYQDLTALSPEEKAFVTLAKAAVDSGDWVGLGNVRVLNNVEPGGKINRQDLLALVVPAPGALVLAGIGTALVGWMRRRRAW